MGSLCVQPYLHLHSSSHLHVKNTAEFERQIFNRSFLTFIVRLKGERKEKRLRKMSTFFIFTKNFWASKIGKRECQLKNNIHFIFFWSSKHIFIFFFCVWKGVRIIIRWIEELAHNTDIFAIFRQTKYLKVHFNFFVGSFFMTKLPRRKTEVVKLVFTPRRWVWSRSLN